jgi:uncharacterized protein with FMN-binding domain
MNIKTTIGIAVIIIFCVGAGIIVITHQPSADSKNSVSPAVVSGTQPAVTPSSVPKNSTYAYKNGTYNATGSYDSPAGIENVEVSVTLTDGVITNSTVSNLANDGTSRRYQNMFIGGYKTYVNGKNISSVHIGKISGSSLTGTGFNAALEKIKNQAKV